MAKRDTRSQEQKIKDLEAQLMEKERELSHFRSELETINLQLEKFIGQMATELKLASLIQRSMVPQEIPTIPGFQFSSKFVSSSLSGGDYFDIFELEDKMRFGILMANSSGHGMASLFMSVLLKLTTQIEARKGMEADDVLTHMVKALKESAVKPADQVNIFYAVVDRRHYSLTYSRAGSAPAYIYKYADDKLVSLDATHPPLTVKSSPQFKSESLSLDPRDRLVIVSEGATKVKNKKGEAFGLNRLQEVLVESRTSTPHEIRNEVLFQTKKFSDGEEFPQDISVIVMAVKDKVIKLRSAP